MAKPGSKTSIDKARHDGILIATWVLAIAAVLLTVFVRIRLLNIPLERDEGEYAYMGQLILNGIAPYKLAYTMKLPGTHAVYALIMGIFGQSIAGIHIGLMLANLGAAVLIFALARRLWNTQAALLAAASYPVLTVGLAVVGLSAHATQFQMPMVLGGVILLLKALESDGKWILFLSGLLMGMAYITKQQAFLFPLFGGCWLLWHMVRSTDLKTPARVARVAVYACGIVIPFAAVCAIMYAAGVWDRFWFWTVTYASNYIGQTPFAMGMKIFGLSTISAADFIWVLLIPALIGLVALCWDKGLRKNTTFVGSYLVVSFLAVCPGFYFRPHYYVQVMPAVALLIGASSAYLSRPRGKSMLAIALRVLPLVLFAAGVTHAFLRSSEFFFRATPVEAARITYGSSPFGESVEVARWLRQHTKPGEKIAVVGSEPQIYLYADRPSATGYVYAYELMEEQPFAGTMQDEMISEIEKARPRYLVYVKVFTSWAYRPNSDLHIVDWFARYSAENYDVVGLANIVTPDYTEYTWGEDAADLAPGAENALYVFERKPGR